MDLVRHWIEGKQWSGTPVRTVDVFVSKANRSNCKSRAACQAKTDTR